jgi:hypothetical protein
MKSLSKTIFGAACLLALGATTASADIVCNAEGDCWHVKDKYVYRSEFGLTIHPDSWKWGEHDRFRWREHEGRGYWRNGAWIEF